MLWTSVYLAAYTSCSNQSSKQKRGKRTLPLGNIRGASVSKDRLGQAGNVYMQGSGVLSSMHAKITDVDNDDDAVLLMQVLVKAC